MADYPDNSNASKDKKLGKVTTGKVTVVKKTGVEKFFRGLMPGNSPELRDYIQRDVIMSGIKSIILEVLTTMLLGDSGRTDYRLYRNANKVPYQRFSDTRRNDNRGSIDARPRDIFDFDGIRFASRGDAEIVLDKLDSAIESYDSVTVGDFYELAGLRPDGYTKNKYGWTDLRSARIVRLRPRFPGDEDGYIIQFPRPIQLD